MKLQDVKPGDQGHCNGCGQTHTVKDSEPGGIYWVKCPTTDKSYIVGMDSGPDTEVVGIPSICEVDQ